MKEEHRFPTTSASANSELGLFKNPRVQQIADKASYKRFVPMFIHMWITHSVIFTVLNMRLYIHIYIHAYVYIQYIAMD